MTAPASASLETALAVLSGAAASGELTGESAARLASALLETLSAVLADESSDTTTGLRQLRLSRGWSQRDLYRRLCGLAADDGARLPSWEAFKRNLSRWENGDVAAVTPFYRQLLARLFDRNPVVRLAVAA